MPQVVEVPGIGDVEFPDDMTDDQIASAIQKNIGAPAAPQQPFPDIYGGAGGYNPMLSGAMGLVNKTGESLGMTPESSEGMLNAAAPGEVGLQAATGTLGMAAGGLAGLGQGLWNSVVPKSLEGPQAADRIQQVQQAMTYQPRSGAGAGMSRVANLPGEAAGTATNYLGEKTTDITGSPALGALVKTVGDIAPGAAAARFSGLQSPKNQPRGEYTSTKYDVPTTEQLKAAAGENYSAAEKAGVVIRPDSTQRVVEMMQRVADKENLGKLPSKLNEASNVLQERIEAGKPLTLMDADKVRQLIGDAMKSTDATDRRLAKIVQGQYDNYLSSLGKSDTISGDAAQANALLGKARELYKRSKNSELADTLEHKAEKSAETNFTQAGLEHALRVEFKKLSNNDRKMRMLTAAQREAIEKVAAPGKIANTARFVGKFDPTSGWLPAVAAVATGGVLPAVGFVGRRISNAITNRNVNSAREALVGRQPVSGGLLDTGRPTQPLLAQRGLLDGPATLTPAQLRKQIGSLDLEVRRLQAMGPAASTVREAVESELARLQRELAAAEAQGERP